MLQGRSTATHSCRGMRIRNSVRAEAAPVRAVDRDVLGAPRASDVEAGAGGAQLACRAASPQRLRTCVCLNQQQRDNECQSLCRSPWPRHAPWLGVWQRRRRPGVAITDRHPKPQRGGTQQAKDPIVFLQRVRSQKRRLRALNRRRVPWWARSSRPLR